jgi:hypothetical protein
MTPFRGKHIDTVDDVGNNQPHVQANSDTKLTELKAQQVETLGEVQKIIRLMAQIVQVTNTCDICKDKVQELLKD